MKSALRLVFLLIAVFSLAGTQFLFAQGTDLGTIRGTVTDSSGAVVPNAKVTVTDISTGSARETTSNAQGDYQVFGLSSGTYRVTVTNAGMTTVQINGIVVNGSSVISANATMKVASASETIDVTTEGATINTENQTISDSISSNTVIELPRDSRDVYSFLYLNPNITQGSTDGEFKFLGAQSYGASFSLDGQRSNGGIFGEPTSSQPSLEAVGEINVMSNDFTAEYAGIANIRVTTKRGGNGYHGSLFYNNKNSALAAWTLQDQIGKAGFAPTPFQPSFPNPYFNITDLGGSVGGPIPGLKKTFFFAAYERDWNISPVATASSTLPHPTLLAGDFSLIDDAHKPAVPAGTVLTPQEQADDTVGGLGTQFITIPSHLLNPTVQKLIDVYFPHIGLSAPINSNQSGRVPDYFTELSGRSITDTGTLRVDHDFNDNNHLYGTYNASALTSGNLNVQAPYTGLGLSQLNRRNNTVSLSYIHIFSPNVVNEARGGFNRQKLYRHSNTTLEGFLSSVGFDQSDIDAYGAVVGPAELKTFGHPAISLNNTFATFANGGRNTDRPMDQNLATFGDTFSWAVGKHSFKAGADFVRNAAVDGFAVNRGNPRGSMTYGGAGLTPLTNFLLGNAPTSVVYINEPRPPMDVYNWEQGFFVQDDWKVSSRLTVNLGLRYELITPFTEKNDLLVNFDPDFVDADGNKGRFIIPSDKTLEFLDTRIPATRSVVTAAQSGLGVGRSLVRMDKNNLAPRFGLAFRLDSKSVLRGGYGFYYPTSAAQGIRDPIATNPFNQGVTKRNTTAPFDAWPGFAHGISPLTGGTVTAGFAGLPSINAVPVGLQQPRIQQYNATYEREILNNTSIRLSYLGSTLSGLISGTDLNELAPSDTPFGTTVGGDGINPCDPVDAQDCDLSASDIARQAFPGLGDFLLTYGNFGHGRSNAFQAQLEHRYSHGFMLNVSYTYLDQKSTSLDTGNSSLGGETYNPFQPDSDYGQEGYVPKNRIVAYGVWDLPIGKGKKYGSGFSKAIDTILGNWQTSFNMFAKTGTGFTPFWLCDNCDPVVPGNVGSGALDAVGDFNGTSIRPIVVGKPYKNSGNQIWDPNAFDLPSFGATLFSDPQVAKRNLLTGPGTWGVNLGIHKNFHIGERVVAEIGADFNNIFNHPLFSPDSDTGGGGGSFALLGDFSVGVDPATQKVIVGLDPDSGEPLLNRNPDFGRKLTTFSQEGVDSRRTTRLRLRITF